jgi:hypothetical protein
MIRKDCRPRILILILRTRFIHLFYVYFGGSVLLATCHSTITVDVGETPLTVTAICSGVKPKQNNGSPCYPFLVAVDWEWEYNHQA